MRRFLIIILSIAFAYTLQAQQNNCSFCNKTWKNTSFPGHISAGMRDTLMAFSIRFEADKTFKSTQIGNRTITGTYHYHAQHRKIDLHYAQQTVTYLIKGMGENILALETEAQDWPQRLLLEPSENMSISKGVPYVENDSIYSIYIPEGWKINDEDASPALFAGNGENGIIIAIDTADYPDEILRNTLVQMNLSTRYIIKSGLVDTPNRLHGKFLILRSEKNEMIKFYLLQSDKVFISIICICEAREKFTEMEPIFNKIANSFRMK